MSNPYIFTSERLGFRNWNLEDLEEFAELNADEEVMQHFSKTLSTDEVVLFIKRLKAHFVQYGYTYYATELLDTGEFIGMIGIAYQVYESPFTPATDIGWRLKKDAWGKGYATEGAKRCLDYAHYQLGIDKILSVCTIQNQKSENVMKKIGMRKIGEFDHPEMIHHPQHLKHHCYQIIGANKP